MPEFIPDIYGDVVERDGMAFIMPLSDTDKYARGFKESEVKRGGDQDHPGRFSEKGGSGAEEEKEETGEEQTDEERRSELLKANIGIPRHDMPQIIGMEDTSEFVQELTQQGVQTAEAWVPVGQLKGTQSELNMEKVAGMAEAIRSGAWNPSEGSEAVLASADGYILDGHHRWAAQRMVDPNSSMKLLQVNMPIRDLLDEAHSFDDVQYAGVKDKAPVESPEAKPSQAEVYIDGDEAGDDLGGVAQEFQQETGIDPQGLASMVGAPDSAYVTAYLDKNTAGWTAQVYVAEDGDDGVAYEATRLFEFDSSGRWFVKNESLYVDKSLHGNGIGTRMLAKQVEFCRRAGVRYIDTTAAGNSMWEKMAEIQGNAMSESSLNVGYKVWPKLGYQSAIPAWRITSGHSEFIRSVASTDQVEIKAEPLPQEVLDKVCPGGQGCGDNDYVDLHAILKYKQGQEWWDKNGFGHAARFDTAEDSESSKILDKYLRRKRAAGKFAESYQRSENMPSQQTPGEHPDLDAEELADLAQMWNEMEEDEYTTSESQDN